MKEIIGKVVSVGKELYVVISIMDYRFGFHESVKQEFNLIVWREFFWLSRALFVQLFSSRIVPLYRDNFDSNASPESTERRHYSGQWQKLFLDNALGFPFFRMRENLRGKR